MCSRPIGDVGAAWFYNWAAGPERLTAPPGVEFVPMTWGNGSVTPQNLDLARRSGQTLLGFNEPDLGEQSNMTVERALELWPRLRATGMRLRRGAGDRAPTQLPPGRLRTLPAADLAHRTRALTDFAGGSVRVPSPQGQADFVAASTAMLDSLPYVERYAWFSLPAVGDSRTGLYDAAGQPNPAGLAYRQAGAAG